MENDKKNQEQNEKKPYDIPQKNQDELLKKGRQGYPPPKPRDPYPDQGAEADEGNPGWTPPQE